MPLARVYATNADRQRAYRERKKAKEARRVSAPNADLVDRVMAAEDRARAQEDADVGQPSGRRHDA